MHITSLLSFTHRHTGQKGPTEVPVQTSFSEQDYCQHEIAACQAFKREFLQPLLRAISMWFQPPGEKGLPYAQPSIQLRYCPVLHCLALLGGAWLSVPAVQIVTRFLEVLNSSFSSHFPD